MDTSLDELVQAGAYPLELGEVVNFDLGARTDVIVVGGESLTAQSTAKGFMVMADALRVGTTTVIALELAGPRSIVFEVSRPERPQEVDVRPTSIRNQDGLTYRGTLAATLQGDELSQFAQGHSFALRHETESDELVGYLDLQKGRGRKLRIPAARLQGRHRDLGFAWSIGRQLQEGLSDVRGAGGLNVNGVELAYSPEEAPGAVIGWFGAARPTECCTLVDPRSYFAGGVRGVWNLEERLQTTISAGAVSSPDESELHGFGSARLRGSIGGTSFSTTIGRAGAGSAGGATAIVQAGDGLATFRANTWFRDRDYDLSPTITPFGSRGIDTGLRVGTAVFGGHAEATSTTTHLIEPLERTSRQDALGGGVYFPLPGPFRGAANYRYVEQRTDVAVDNSTAYSHTGSGTLNAQFRRVSAMTTLSVSRTDSAAIADAKTRLGAIAQVTWRPNRISRLVARYRALNRPAESRTQHGLQVYWEQSRPRFYYRIFSSTALGTGAAPGFFPMVGTTARYQANQHIAVDLTASHAFRGGQAPSTTTLRAGITLNTGPLNDLAQLGGRITGHVFDDVNGDGVQDEGELPLANATVNVPGVGAVTTDDNGAYALRGVPPGDYEVMASAPGMRRHSAPPTAHVAPLSRRVVDLPLWSGGRIDVFTFVDRNGNGAYDVGELSVPVRATAATALDGEGSFPISLREGRGTLQGVPMGRYRVSVDNLNLPAGYLPDATEVDVQLTPGRVAQAYLTFTVQHTVAGVLWRDGNGDGVGGGSRDERVDDVTVRLNDLNLESGPNGTFLFRDVPPGEYALSVDLPSVPIRLVIPEGPFERTDLQLVVLDPEFIERLATSDGYLPYIDPLTDEQAVDEASGRPVVINPATGGPATLNPQTGLLEGWTPPVAVAVADVEPYLDPDTGEQVVDAASGRPVVIDPATGLPALEDPNTGAMVAWTPPPEVAVVELSPYIDPETGRPVVDEATGRPVVVDPDTGLPALEDPDTGELVAWSPPVEADPIEIVEAPSFVDPATSAPVIDPPSGRPVVVNPATGLPALQDPSTGEFAAWRPPAGMEVTLPPYVDPETGSAVIDPVSGEQVVVDPVTEAPALRDVNSGTFTPYDLADATPTPLVDPETGTAVTDPESGAAVVLHPRTGLPSVMDPELGRLVDWEPPDLPSYEPLVTADGTAVTDPQGRSVFLDDQGRTVVVDPDTNEATVVVLDSGPPALTRLRITPDDIILAPLEELQLTASGAFTDDSVRDLTRSVEWSSSRPSVLSVDAGGLLSANSVGFAELSASFEGVQAATVRVEVIDVPVAGLTIQPAELVVQPGGTMQMTAEAIYTDGRIADVTDAIRWFTSNPNVATVDRRGVVTGVAPGQATVNGEFQGIRGFRASIEVGDLGAESLVVQGMDTSYATGEVITPTLLAVLPDGSLRDVSDDATWEVSDPLLLAVSSDGSLRARGEGSVQVTASWGGAVSDTMTLTLTDSPPAGMTLFPPVQALVIGGTEDLSATAVYADGTVREVTDRADWVSSNPSVVEVLPGGRVRAVAVGSAQVTAARGEVRTEALTIRVLDPANAAVTLEPRSLSLEMGAEANLRAYAIADDERIDVTELSQWQSGDAGIATVSGTGRVSGVAPGSTRIFARWGSMITPNASVDVTLPPVLMVTGDLVLERLPIGAEVELSASAVTQADASFIDVSRGMEWRSSNPRVIAIRGNTLVAQSVGSATITGTVEGNTTQPMTIEVTDVRVDGLTLVELPDMRVGDVQPAYATANLADGTSIDLTWSVTWSSSNEAVLTVQEDNLLRATGAGTATLTATFGEVTVSRTVTVGR